MKYTTSFLLYYNDCKVVLLFSNAYSSHLQIQSVAYEMCYKLLYCMFLLSAYKKYFNDKVNYF